MAAFREQVLGGWGTTPSRFREDANAEQDAALGGYADRLVVELAQNAADAAGGGGRLLFRWTPAGLLAANTGHRLTGAGVVSLCTLRASEKVDRHGTYVGRFGVGFAAVLAVTDAPAIGSRGETSIRWSGAKTAELVASLPSLAGDLAARGGHVPVLRLPFADDPLDVPDGYDTAVWLPWRDEAAASTGAAMLAEVDTTLLLSLPGLAEIRLEGVGSASGGSVVFRCEWDGGDPTLDGRSWLGHEISGTVEESLLDDRPAEDRERRYRVQAFAPADGGALPAGTAAVVRAPTVTDEPLSAPAVLIASVPLEPTRRRVVRGPLAAFVLAAAGRCVAELAIRLGDVYPFVPVGLAAGDLDAAVRASTLTALRELPVYQGLSVDRLAYLDLGEATAEVAEILGAEISGLLPSAWSEPGRLAAATALGIRQFDTADVVAALSARQRTPPFWHRAYRALAHAPDRDALSALPIPLLDGRVVTGARGALLPDGEVSPSLAVLPVRLVHPDAVHPLLERLGARTADAAALLTDPAVRQAVEASVDLENSAAFARAVAELVVESKLGVRDRPWLAALALPAQGGGTEAAADLVWPGSPMEALLDPAAGFRRLDPPFWLDREVASRLGVADRPVVTRYLEVPLAVDADDESGFFELDDVDGWIDELVEGVEDPDAVILPEVLAVQDLGAIANPAGLLALLPGDPALRSAIIQPVHVHGRRARSYSAWWLSRRPVFEGARPPECTLAGVRLLGGRYDGGLYDIAPDAFGEDVLRALGVRTDVAEVLRRPDDLAFLLGRLGDDARSPRRPDVVAIHAAIAESWASRIHDAPEPPARVRAVRSDGSVVAAPAEECVVVDAPDLLAWAWAGGRAVLLARLVDAEILADLLDLDLASELPWPPPPTGRVRAVPEVLLALAPRSPATYVELDSDAVGWRFVDDTLYASTRDLASAVAWAAGVWHRRHLLRVAIEQPDALATAMLESELAGDGAESDAG